MDEFTKIALIESENIKRFKKFTDEAMRLIKYHFTDFISFAETGSFKSEYTATYETDDYILTITTGIHLKFNIVICEKGTDAIILKYENEYGKTKGIAYSGLVMKYNLTDFDIDFSHNLYDWKDNVWNKPYEFDVP